MKLKKDKSLTILAPSTIGRMIELENEGINLFDDIALEFFAELSKLILSDPEMKEYPELVSFGFFCRKASLNKIVQNYSDDNSFRFGRGIVFHVTPSNVPMNFAYSLFSGLLTGNINIVRVPSKNFVEIDLLIAKINALLEREKFYKLSKRVLIIRYNSDSSWTSLFSKQCDVRVLWGGDKTIDSIRINQLKSSATDITFYDRISACVIDCNSVLELKSLKRLVSDFFIDTLFFDQNACTSPKQIFWLGDDITIEQARPIFWKEYKNELLRRDYKFPDNSTVGKVTTVMEKLANGESLLPLTFNSHMDPLIKVSFTKSFDINENDFVKAGLFFETNVNSLSQISEFLTKRHQTLSYFGLDKAELLDFITSIRPNVDRIVPVGRTMDFSLTWDGYNLISSLSRSVDLI